MSILSQIKFQARRSVNLCLRGLLRLRSRRLKVEEIPEALIVSPHQDDEALGCSGLIMALKASGAAIRVVYLTDGSASHRDYPEIHPADLARIRREEAIEAMAGLGLGSDQLVFLDIKDGTLDQLPPSEEMRFKTRLQALLSQPQRVTLFTPSRHDGSSEHEAAFRILTEMLREMPSPCRIVEYPVWSWWSPKLLLRNAWNSPRVLRLQRQGQKEGKIRALSCYRSQHSPMREGQASSLPENFMSSFKTDTEYFFEW